MIILITASLSSNTCNKASWYEDGTFEGIKSTLSKSLITLWDCLRFWFVWGQTTGLPFYDGSELCFQGLKQSDPIKSRKGMPSNLNPASKEMISDSIELCETEVCFLHIQLIGTNVWLPKTHNVPPEVDFESSRSPAKSEENDDDNGHSFSPRTQSADLPWGPECLCRGAPLFGEEKKTRWLQK